MRKRLIAGILAAVMVVSSLQLQTVSIMAQEMYQETEEASLIMEDVDAETQMQEEEAAVEDAETENSGVTEDKEQQTDESEIAPDISNEESDLESSTDVETEDGAASEPAVSDDIDSTSQIDMEEESNEASEDDTQLLADENAEDIIDSGKINNITWTIDKEGLLTITGTGDYISETEDNVDGDGFVPPWAGRDDVLSAVVNVSDITSTKNMFYDMKKLTSIDLTNIDTSKVTDMSSMFDSCWSLNSLDLSGFNTSNVTNMSRMFFDCERLTSLDLSSFDTGNVTNMRWMFHQLLEPISLDLSSFDTSKVKNMSGMFTYSRGLSSLDLSNFDTGNVTNMSAMFEDCNGLTSLDLSSFNTSKVTNMLDMFINCDGLTSLDLSNFDTSNVTDMAGMFQGCSSLTSLNISSFDTSNVTRMLYMFADCSSLTNLDVSSFDTSKVTNMSNMFEYCNSLFRLDLASFDAGNVIDMSNMFRGCRLSYIRTPKNCPEGVAAALPVGKWYQDIDTICTELPTGLAYSIELYENGYPGDGKTKKNAFVSGITINTKAKDYDAEPVLMDDKNAVVKDSEGNILSDVTISYSYKGTLAKGTSYEETSQAPSQAGKYTVTCTAENDVCAGQIMYNFEIRQVELTITAASLSIKIGDELPELSGLEYTVEGLIKGEKLITEPRFVYPTNVSNSGKGSYAIIPYGADAGNNYSIKYVYGTLTVSETGEKPPIGGGDDNPPSGDDDDPPHNDSDDDSHFDDDERIDLISVSGTIANIKAKTYDGSPYEPTVKVTVLENNKKKTLTEGIDYRVEYKNNVNAGSGSVIVKGNGIYKGELPEKSFTINPKSIKKLKVIAGSVAVGDTASSVPIYVYDGNTLLEEGNDYTLSGTENLTSGSNAGKSVKVTINAIEGKSNYTGSTTAKIAIYNVSDVSKIINPDDITLRDPSNSNAIETKDLQVHYTGKAIKPIVTVTKDGASSPLTNRDYKVQYQNNKNAGTAYVIVTGKGEYKGKVVKSFEISPNTALLEITNKTIKDKTYNGKLQKPSVNVKAGDKKLKKNKDYTVTYKNNLHAGTATIIVTGIGNYEGALKAERTFKINPQKISKISIKGTQKDGLTITYSKHRLKEGVDYTLEYDEASKTNSKIKVKIKAVETAGKEHDFTGSVTKSVKIQ